MLIDRCDLRIRPCAPCFVRRTVMRSLPPWIEAGTAPVHVSPVFEPARHSQRFSHPFSTIELRSFHLIVPSQNQLLYRLSRHHVSHRCTKRVQTGYLLSSISSRYQSLSEPYPLRANLDTYNASRSFCGGSPLIIKEQISSPSVLGELGGCTYQRTGVFRL